MKYKFDKDYVDLPEPLPLQDQEDQHILCRELIHIYFATQLNYRAEYFIVDEIDRIVDKYESENRLQGSLLAWHIWNSYENTPNRNHSVAINLCKYTKYIANAERGSSEEFERYREIILTFNR